MGILLFVVSVAWMEAMGCLLFRRTLGMESVRMDWNVHN